MHPAFSVIFFTSASGAGYGLLIVLGVGYLAGVIPEHTSFLLISIGFALLLITLGLLSSTFHLGHPERAWRALSQWRSSWLSREGVLAIFSYLPVLLFLFGALIFEKHDTLLFAAALLMSISCLCTVYATAMIYASLNTVHAWSNHWVPLAYIVLALMSGAVLLKAIYSIFFLPQIWLTYSVLILITIAAAVKWLYWKYIRDTKSESTPESATGLGQFGEATLSQSPHSQENYLLKEMGFQIGRKHANRLRRICVFSGFVFPFILTALMTQLSGLLVPFASVLALISCATGVLIERWLFFAEAKHTVMLYYGSKKV